MTTSKKKPPLPVNVIFVIERGKLGVYGACFADNEMETDCSLGLAQGEGSDGPVRTAWAERYIPVSCVRELRAEIALMRNAASYDGGFEAAQRDALRRLDKLLAETEE